MFGKSRRGTQGPPLNFDHVQFDKVHTKVDQIGEPKVNLNTTTIMDCCTLGEFLCK